MTQKILNAMDSDEVNSISDTVESAGVAMTIEECYYDMLSEQSFPERNIKFNLTASGDSALPTLMTLPTNVIGLETVKYDNKATGDSYENYVTVKYQNFDDFIEAQEGYREMTTDVGSMDVTVDGNTFAVMYHSNKMPEYYTVVGDNYLIFDSYDADEDTTLQSSKSLCYGVGYPTFSQTDSHTPDLDARLFSQLIQKAKKRCFLEKKQIANREAEGEERRQKIASQKFKWTTPEPYATSRRFGRK